ncbi:hypothetical protein L5515_002275 [Caenorhabditis briggsae]|uniref:Uncharacterized protein n=1 Tax=Caenorhabditis briggsae TaxID=6238 RepID=A0AAE9E5B4_CAEBR|nr:hypothetical protein L5515_002275 [Caenorhabditis briggsae]
MQSLRMMNGIENFVNARAPPQASISFEVISEETCDPPTTEGEILTEQPIKLWVTKEKMFPKLDSATTHFVFIVSTDLALGPMSPLPTKKGALFSKGMDTDMASETQRRVIRQMLAATGTSQLAQYVKEGRCHIIVASHQDESRDPTDAPKSRTCSENTNRFIQTLMTECYHIAKTSTIGSPLCSSQRSTTKCLWNWKISMRSPLRTV